MRTYKFFNSKNFFFVSLILLTHLFFCFGIHFRDSINTVDISNLLQMTEELREIETNSTEPKTDNNSTAESTGAPAAPTQNASSEEQAKKDADAKNTKESLEKNNQKLEDLEKTLKEQAKYFEDIKRLLDEVDNLSVQMNKTESKNEEILTSVGDLKELYSLLDYKMTATSLQMDNKLNMINAKLVNQLKIQLSNQLLNLQRDIADCQDQIEKLKNKIKILKSKLPNPDSVCTMYNSCASCTTNPACGWCSISQQCVDGDEKGPADGSCTFYEYNICGGPRECDSYKDCNECIRDISCGWCNNQGNPLCMDKDSADSGECHQDRFIHLWNSLNICPHNTIDNFKGKLLQDFKDNVDVDAGNKKSKKPKNPLDMDPQQKKKLVEEIKVFEEEKTKKEVLLEKLIKAFKKTEEQTKALEKDNVTFNLADVQEDKDKFYEISKSVFDMLKDYLVEFSTQALRNNTNTNNTNNYNNYNTNMTFTNVTLANNDTIGLDGNSGNATEGALVKGLVNVRNTSDDASSGNVTNVTNVTNMTDLNSNNTNVEPQTNQTEIPANNNTTVELSNSTIEANTNNQNVTGTTDLNNSTNLNEAKNNQTENNSTSEGSNIDNNESKLNETTETRTEAVSNNTETDNKATDNAESTNNNATEATNSTAPENTQNVTDAATQTPSSDGNNSTGRIEDNSNNQTESSNPSVTVTEDTPNSNTNTTDETSSTETSSSDTATGESPQSSHTKSAKKTTTKDLLQISSDFGVDKDTFVNSFVETSSHKILSPPSIFPPHKNLRPSQSKTIIL